MFYFFRKAKKKSVSVIHLSITILILLFSSSLFYNFSLKQCIRPQHGTTPYGRIIATRDDIVKWKTPFTITINVESCSDVNNKGGKKGGRKKTDKGKNEECTDPLHLLCTKTSHVWAESIKEMESTYKEHTKELDANWSSHLWDTVWVPYLESVHTFIGSKLNIPDLPLRDKEKIIDLWLNWTKEDFKVFLKPGPCRME